MAVGIEQRARAIVDDWNAHLGVTTSPVRIAVLPVRPDIHRGRAFSDFSDDGQGFQITLDPGLASASNETLRRTIVHELVHIQALERAGTDAADVIEHLTERVAVLSIALRVVAHRVKSERT